MFLFQRVTVGTPYFFLHFYIYRSPQKKSTAPKTTKRAKQTIPNSVATAITVFTHRIK